MTRPPRDGSASVPLTAWQKNAAVISGPSSLSFAAKASTEATCEVQWGPPRTVTDRGRASACARASGSAPSSGKSTVSATESASGALGAALVATACVASVAEGASVQSNDCSSLSVVLPPRIGQQRPRHVPERGRG